MNSLHACVHLPPHIVVFKFAPSRILFIKDDCNWADHVGDLDRELGVVGVRTPHGLTMEAFHFGLEKFRLANSSVDAENNSNG